MAKLDEAYTKILTDNLQRAIDWLKFAEAKNAALLGIASAWTLAGINIACSDKLIPQLLHGCILMAVAFSGAAGLISMLSFLPRLKRAAFSKGNTAIFRPQNLLFYGDIGATPADELEAAFQKRYGSGSQSSKDEYLHDLVEQIRINSTIARDKMITFTWGARAMLISVFILVLGACIYAGQELAAL